MADRGQMEWVRLNLAVNARNAMRGGEAMTNTTRFTETRLLVKPRESLAPPADVDRPLADT